VQEGVVGAGDEIRVLHREQRGLSVCRVSDLLYSADRDEASRPAALGIPALSEGWRWSFRRLLAAEGPGNTGLAPQPTARPACSGFRDFLVTRLVHEAVHVVSLHLAPADGAPAPS
jgi:hypothetical protein